MIAPTLSGKTRNASLSRTLSRAQLYNKRYIAILAALLVLVTSCFLYLFWQQATSVLDLSEQLSHSRDVITVLGSTLSTLRDAESSERGFSVTGEPLYLQPYYAAHGALQGQVTDLEKITQLNPRKRGEVAHLKELIQSRISDLDEIVALRNQGNYKQSMLLIMSGRGKYLMDQINACVGTMKAGENALIQERSSRMHSYSRVIHIALPLVLVAICLLVGAIGYLLIRFMAEKKLSDAKLQHAYSLFENFMDNSPCIAFIKERSGRYIYTNKNLEERYGRSDRPIAGSIDSEWLPPELAAELNEQERAVIESMKPLRRIEVIPKPNHEPETLFVVKFPVSDLAGNKFVGGVAIDITDMKRAEHQIAHLNESLQTRVKELEMLTPKLEAARDEAMNASRLKSQFIANVSHEIRTPMSGVLGMSELLLENDLDSDSKELVYYIHDSAKNLLAVVNDLLDFSKLEAGRVELAEEILSVQGLIENVIHSVMPDAHKKNLLVKGSVGTEVSNDLVGDACRIRQVLLNLTHNAVKFTASGSVHITADVTRCSEEIVVVRFEVKDTGIGIGAEPLATLFKPFVQADGSTTRKYGGTGLGLSICKALVELMSGELGVDSLAGAGSTFWFSIPLKSIDRIPEAEPTIFRAAS